MRKTKENTELSRRNLIDAAKRIFSEKGYAATKLEDIGKAVGMTRGVVYWHFKNKAELFQFLVEDVLKSFEKSFDELYATKQPLIEKLRSMYLYVNKNQSIALLQSIGPQDLDENSVKYVNEIANRFITKVVKEFDDAKTSGEIHADTDVKSILGLMTVFMSGLENSKHTRLSFQTSSDNVESMIDMIFKGISSIQK